MHPRTDVFIQNRHNKYSHPTPGFIAETSQVTCLPGSERRDLQTCFCIPEPEHFFEHHGSHTSATSNKRNKKKTRESHGNLEKQDPAGPHRPGEAAMQPATAFVHNTPVTKRGTTVV
jgi:hypothetical protein